jgi:hypothetical protein
MKKKLLEAMMTPALQAAQALTKEGTNQIPSTYKGYVAAFGPSTLQMGLKPTVFRYARDKENSAGRGKVLDAMFSVLCATGRISQTRMLDYVNALRTEDMRSARERILHACVALKLAMNTFAYIVTEENDGKAE